jgi:hypothetical protein
MIFNACTLASSLLAFSAKSIKNSNVKFNNTGSLDAGSALKIASIVGGIPADLLKIVLTFSLDILSKAVLNNFYG